MKFRGVHLNEMRCVVARNKSFGNRRNGELFLEKTVLCLLRYWRFEFVVRFPKASFISCNAIKI